MCYDSGLFLRNFYHLVIVLIIYFFLFREFLSLEPTGLPRLKCGPYLFVLTIYFIELSTRTRVLGVVLCDLVIFGRLVKAFGS